MEEYWRKKGRREEWKEAFVVMGKKVLKKTLRDNIGQVPRENRCRAKFFGKVAVKNSKI